MQMNAKTVHLSRLHQRHQRRTDSLLSVWPSLCPAVCSPFGRRRCKHSTNQRWLTAEMLPLPLSANKPPPPSGCCCVCECARVIVAVSVTSLRHVALKNLKISCLFRHATREGGRGAGLRQGMPETTARVLLPDELLYDRGFCFFGHTGVCANQ